MRHRLPCGQTVLPAPTRRTTLRVRLEEPAVQPAESNTGVCMVGRKALRRGLWIVLVAASGGGAPLDAQEPLTPADYGQWERLGTFELDPTGRWVVASITRVDGDGELRLHRADASGDPIVLPHASSWEFSADGRWMAYRKGTSEEDSDATEEPIEERLGLVDLESGRDSVHSDVRRISFRDDGAWVAALGAPASDSVGADLLLMDPASGEQIVIGNVSDFAWQDGGTLLAATLETASGSANGVVLFDLEAGTLRTLTSADADFTALTWDDDSARLAVMRSFEDDDREEASHDLLVWDDVTRGEAPDLLVAAERAELGREVRVTPYAGIDFSDDGEAVFVGVRPWDVADGGADEDAPEDDDAGGSDGEDAVEEGADDDVEPADVQVWHWDDDEILRAQEWAANRIARQTLLAVWHRDSDDFVVLGEELEEPVRVVDGGAWAVVPDYEPYLFERRFGAGTADWYRVDVRDGARTLIEAGVEFGLQAHDDLGYALYYTNDQWHAVELASLDRVPVAEGRSFTRSLADYDYPGPRPSWGMGGWGEDGRTAWLYDRHDVWRVDLGNGVAVRLTDGAASGEQFRLVNLDPEQPRFGPALHPSDDPLVLSVRHFTTKASGYVSVEQDGDERWAMRRDALVGGLTRASDAGALAFRSERWDDSPDVFVAGGNMDDPTQVTTTNPFQADYAWGRTELLDYTTDAGHDLQAMLVYPADFEEGQRYPLILYQYERLSDGLHRYSPPSERQYYNQQAWSQAGYFVLNPDIVYEPGRPGPSALDAVEHALDAAVATGHVDPGGMGLIGHSWGGYQASYLPTRTDRFAASVAGAAITNFMSFMGAVHWNGGLPETGHWETGQARMAAPYWEDLEGHLESSPANFIEDLETPMLLMHGDADGVVDFYQGLEFYNYARRAGKEVVLLVYPGADHGLSEEAQQVDYHRRILEWFGHYLKGEPAAAWISEGESWVERGRRIGG